MPLAHWAEAIPSAAPLVCTNVSSATTLFELSGAQAIDVLMRDCTLDLEGNAVPPSACAQTHLAQTTVSDSPPDDRHLAAHHRTLRRPTRLGLAPRHPIPFFPHPPSLN